MTITVNSDTFTEVHRLAEIEELRKMHEASFNAIAHGMIARSNLLRAARERGETMRQLAFWEGYKNSSDIYPSFLSRSVRIAEEKPDNYFNIHRFVQLSGIPKVHVWLDIIDDKITDQILWRNAPYLKWEG